MAGHSQFKNIMHRKGRQDAVRSKLFSKLAREITVAAKLGVADPTMNARLRAAILAAGCEITELTPDEHRQFRAAVTPMLDEARGQDTRSAARTAVSANSRTVWVSPVAITKSSLVSCCNMRHIASTYSGA